MISHSFLPFPVLPGMLTVIVEVDYLETMMEPAAGFPNTQYFFLLLELFLHLKVQMNLKTWLAETDKMLNKNPITMNQFTGNYSVLSHLTKISHQ